MGPGQRVRAVRVTEAAGGIALLLQAPVPPWKMALLHSRLLVGEHHRESWGLLATPKDELLARRKG